MQLKSICAPAFRRRSQPTGPAAAASLAGEIRAARREIGAGPTWGGSAAVVLVAASVTVAVLAGRSEALGTPAAGVALLGVVLAGFAVAGWLCRGADFNKWLEYHPRHGRGSCQWLIWRGELSGRPCAACLAGMGRRERRYWLSPTATIVVSTVPATPAGRPGRRALPRADAGAVSVESLLLTVLPPFLLFTATVAGFSSDPRTHSATWPLLLAGLVLAALNLHLAHTTRRTASDTAARTAACGVAVDPAGCESCRRLPGTVAVRFPDGVTFTVCGTCLAGGCFHPAPRAIPGGLTSTGEGVARWKRVLTAVIALLLTPFAISGVQKAADAGHTGQAVAAAVLAAGAAFTVGWVTAQVGMAVRSYATPHLSRGRWGGGWR